LNVYGRPTREKIPITVRSTFSVVIHACKVVPVRASGIPEENPRSRTKKMRRFPNAFSSADMRGIVPPMEILKLPGIIRILLTKGNLGILSQL